MLSVKNLTKIYRPKKGQPVLGINDITLKFPEKGMVFLLGKSGSGKSTLLNLLGGLDNYTSGEIIIKGKSSKEFKASDFDSYRNTYIGFIFQEFNILDEYSVGENISIALKLQHKTADRDSVEKIMELVGLEKTHFDRRINELSGGQKQRVAIARALVKNPDIIMADEPTGNLDSQTSEQIFKALKELSKEKLVIVVSHDRENAENYGDRIIELGDGKIINDTDANQTIKHVESNAEFNLIKSRLPIKDCIKMGASGLKLKRIRLAFIFILSIIAFTLFGLSSTFYSYNQYRTEIETIRKNGENTLLISDIYARDPSYRYSFNSTGLTFEQISRIEELTGNKVLKLWDSTHETDFVINSFARIPNYSYYATYFTNLIEISDTLDANLISAADGSRLPSAGNFEEIAISDWIADSFIEFGLNKGGEEKKINCYADLLNETIEVQAFGLGRSSKGTVNLKITGVYKTDIDKERYAEYRSKSEISVFDSYILGARNRLIFSMGFVAPNFNFPNGQESIKIGLADYQFITESGKILPVGYPTAANNIDILNDELVYLGGRSLSSLESDEIIVSAGILCLESNLNDVDKEMLKEIFNNFTEEDKKITAKQNLKEIGSFRVAGVYLESIYSYEIYLKNEKMNSLAIGSGALRLRDGSNFGQDLGLYLSEGQNLVLNKIWKASDYNLSSLPIYWGVGTSPKEKLADNEIILGVNTLRSLLGPDARNYSDLQLRNAFNDLEKTMEFGLLIYHGLQRSIVNGKLIKAVGVNFEENYGAPLFGDGIFTLAKEIRTNSVSVIVKLSDDWKKNYELFDYLLNEGGYSNEVYSKIKPYSQSTDVLDAAATWTNIFKTIFLYASIGISFFAGLMLMNFIGISIADKKKTIGILRAIGARSADVFKIFFSEGLIVSGIIFMLSFLSVVLISMIINSLFTMSVLIPTIIQALLMAVLSFGVMSIATILPIYKIAIKKPVDAINNK